MRVRLSEHPQDWRKFSASLGVVSAVVVAMLWRRRTVPPEMAWVLLGLISLTVAASWLFPRFGRAVYRVGMTIAHQVGRVAGAVFLALFFLLVLTPVGLLLRLTGKDLLNRRFRAGAASYWRPARGSGEFDRMF